MSQVSFASDTTLGAAPMSIDATSSETLVPNLDILQAIKKTHSTDDFDDPALHEECMQVATTFLFPNTSKTLRVEPEVRERIMQQLETSCHYNLVRASAYSLYKSC